MNGPRHRDRKAKDRERSALRPMPAEGKDGDERGEMTTPPPIPNSPLIAPPKYSDENRQDELQAPIEPHLSARNRFF